MVPRLHRCFSGAMEVSFFNLNEKRIGFLLCWCFRLNSNGNFGFISQFLYVVGSK